jgi:hypothetical protein
MFTVSFNVGCTELSTGSRLWITTVLPTFIVVLENDDTKYIRNTIQAYFYNGREVGDLKLVMSIVM